MPNASAPANVQRSPSLNAFGFSGAGPSLSFGLGEGESMPGVLKHSLSLSSLERELQKQFSFDGTLTAPAPAPLGASAEKNTTGCHTKGCIETDFLFECEGCFHHFCLDHLDGHQCGGCEPVKTKAPAAAAASSSSSSSKSSVKAKIKVVAPPEVAGPDPTLGEGPELSANLFPPCPICNLPIPLRVGQDRNAVVDEHMALNHPRQMPSTNAFGNFDHLRLNHPYGGLGQGIYGLPGSNSTRARHFGRADSMTSGKPPKKRKLQRFRAGSGSHVLDSSGSLESNRKKMRMESRSMSTSSITDAPAAGQGGGKPAQKASQQTLAQRYLVIYTAFMKRNQGAGISPFTLHCLQGICNAREKTEKRQIEARRKKVGSGKAGQKKSKAKETAGKDITKLESGDSMDIDTAAPKKHHSFDDPANGALSGTSSIVKQEKPAGGGDTTMFDAVPSSSSSEPGPAPASIHASGMNGGDASVLRSENGAAAATSDGNGNATKANVVKVEPGTMSSSSSSTSKNATIKDAKGAPAAAPAAALGAAPGAAASALMPSPPVEENAWNPLWTSWGKMQVMSAIATAMLLNEFEVVAWAIYLDKLGWFQPYLHPVEALTMSCLAVKMAFTPDTSYFEPYLNSQWNGFTYRFSQWSRSRAVKKIVIPPVRMNMKFVELGASFKWITSPKKLPLPQLGAPGLLPPGMVPPGMLPGLPPGVPGMPPLPPGMVPVLPPGMVPPLPPGAMAPGAAPAKLSAPAGAPAQRKAPVQHYELGPNGSIVPVGGKKGAAPLPPAPPPAAAVPGALPTLPGLPPPPVGLGAAPSPGAPGLVAPVPPVPPPIIPMPPLPGGVGAGPPLAAPPPPIPGGLPAIPPGVPAPGLPPVAPVLPVPPVLGAAGSGSAAKPVAPPSVLPTPLSTTGAALAPAPPCNVPGAAAKGGSAPVAAKGAKGTAAAAAAAPSATAGVAASGK